MKSVLQVPQHIAVIMDGNRRWARKRKLPVYAGHDHVANVVLEPLIEHAAKRGIKYMTFWAFSTENWNREKREVTAILRIFRHVIAKRWQRLHEKGVRVKVIGDLSRFPKDIQENLRKVVEDTKYNTKITATFALSYGGRDDVLRAIQKYKENSHSVKKLSQEEFSALLDTAGTPDPEIVVRPGGEKRLSGFMLWQSEYSELFFKDWYMPEFTPKKLDELLEEFAIRQRRFGR